MKDTTSTNNQPFVFFSRPDLILQFSGKLRKGLFSEMLCGGLAPLPRSHSLSLFLSICSICACSPSSLSLSPYRGRLGLGSSPFLLFSSHLHYSTIFTITLNDIRFYERSNINPLFIITISSFSSVILFTLVLIKLRTEVIKYQDPMTAVVKSRVYVVQA